ncbi:MAG: anti-sigma factor [Bauldia sp.]|nr:anti-sigma factor [Bauldia sp.]
MSEALGRPVTEEDLVALADDRLDAARSAEVEAWLGENPSERDRVAGWRRQSAMLRGALDPVAAEPAPPALVAALTPPPRSRWQWPSIAAVAAGIVGGVFAGWMIWGSAVPLQAREMVAIGLSAHQVYIQEVRHPVEVTVAEADHLTSWLSNRIDTEVAPPDLTAAGLALLGGRVVPENGWPAALLMYENAAGERFTLLIVHYREAANTAFRYTTQRDFGAVWWMDGEVGYVFSGPDDRARLLDLSRSIYDQVS